MTAKHSTGPWKLQDNPVAPCQLLGDGDIHIADIYMTDFPFGAANARLIAAAPELLEALQHIVYACGSHSGADKGTILRTAEAAIQKALGGQ